MASKPDPLRDSHRPVIRLTTLGQCGRAMTSDEVALRMTTILVGERGRI